MKVSPDINTSGPNANSNWIDRMSEFALEITWPDGAHYQGGYAHGDFSGQGRLHYADGGDYEGGCQDRCEQA